MQGFLELRGAGRPLPGDGVVGLLKRYRELILVALLLVLPLGVYFSHAKHPSERSRLDRVIMALTGPIEKGIGWAVTGGDGRLERVRRAPARARAGDGPGARAERAAARPARDRARIARRTSGSDGCSRLRAGVRRPAGGRRARHRRAARSEGAAARHPRSRAATTASQPMMPVVVPRASSVRVHAVSRRHGRRAAPVRSQQLDRGTRRPLARARQRARRRVA